MSASIFLLATTSGAGKPLTKVVCANTPTLQYKTILPYETLLACLSSDQILQIVVKFGDISKALSSSLMVILSDNQRRPVLLL